MHDEVSIERQLQREESFRPPFCPNSACANHFKEKARSGFFQLHGVKALKRFPYFSKRFRCRDCRSTFSASLFSLHYRQKLWGFNELIWNLHHGGLSKRATGRWIGHSERLVRTRLRNMSRFAELKSAQLTEELKIEEPIVYDGLENFSFSQYDPNNINHAVGKKSLFIYDYNFSPLNRKGSTSPRQKARMRVLEKEFGKYPPNSIRAQTKAIFERLWERAKGSLTIFSDCHYQYRRVVEIDLKDKPISHFKVSSKIHRNFKNHLFAVNNVDMQARHNLAAFKRETIAFSKHEIAMLDSFTLYAAYRNYMRPKFWGTHRSDPESCKKSPAMELGITKKILSFKEFFAERVLPSQVTLNTDARARYDRQMPTSRRKIALAPAF